MRSLFDTIGIRYQRDSYAKGVRTAPDKYVIGCEALAAMLYGMYKKEPHRKSVLVV